MTLFTATKKLLGQHRKGECQISDIKNLELYEFGTFLISLTTDALKYHSIFLNVKFTQNTIIMDHNAHWILVDLMSNFLFSKAIS